MEDIRAGSNGFSAAGFTLNGNAPSFSGGLAGVSGPEGKSGLSVMTPTPENRWGVWVTGIGEFTDVDSTDNAPGYYLQTGGLTLGVDYRVSPNLAIGNLKVNGGTLGRYATAFRQRILRGRRPKRRPERIRLAPDCASRQRQRKYRWRRPQSSGRRRL
jgi:Autotransporter beta-domain